MNDRQKIKAEIEKRMKDCENAFQICPSTAIGSKLETYKNMLSFIDSLPQNDDAIKGEIGDIMPLIEVDEMNNYLKYIKAHGLKPGDKEKIIIIKEE